jgi:hypothetical protein
VKILSMRDIKLAQKIRGGEECFTPKSCFSHKKSKKIKICEKNHFLEDGIPKFHDVSGESIGFFAPMSKMLIFMATFLGKFEAREVDWRIGARTSCLLLTMTNSLRTCLGSTNKFDTYNHCIHVPIGKRKTYIDIETLRNDGKYVILQNHDAMRSLSAPSYSVHLDDATQMYCTHQSGKIIDVQKGCAKRLTYFRQHQ